MYLQKLVILANLSIDLVCDKLDRQVRKFKEKGLSKTKGKVESIRTSSQIEEVEA